MADVAASERTQFYQLLVMETACREKEIHAGRGRESRVVSSLFPHPLFFFHPG